MGAAVINLVSCIGVKTDIPILRHFLDHYHLLGVDRPLIILHAPPGDARVESFFDVLRERRIDPVRVTPEYSARLKKTYSREVVDEHCGPEDWVIYADLDEFQLYPEPLRGFLETCDDQGFDFVRGRLVDRIAAGGELRRIEAAPSLWDQFPFVAPVTRAIGGGWDRKVCAARARIPIAEGGTHAVDYGFGTAKNYQLTHRDPKSHPDAIEIHHFKWDATLRRRVADKLSASGGDLDSLHGPEFIDEYRTLLRHIDRYGGLRVAQAEHRGHPYRP